MSTKYLMFVWLQSESHLCVLAKSELIWIVLIGIRQFSEKKDHMLEANMVQTALTEYGTQIKRQRMTPPLNERVMLYVRQDNEEVYTPLHVVPPTTNGLISAVSDLTDILLQYCNLTSSKTQTNTTS